MMVRLVKRAKPKLALARSALLSAEHAAPCRLGLEDFFCLYIRLWGAKGQTETQKVASLCSASVSWELFFRINTAGSPVSEAFMFIASRTPWHSEKRLSWASCRAHKRGGSELGFCPPLLFVCLLVPSSETPGLDQPRP